MIEYVITKDLKRISGIRVAETGQLHHFTQPVMKPMKMYRALLVGGREHCAW
jgi:hypothetical protein